MVYSPHLHQGRQRLAQGANQRHRRFFYLISIGAFKRYSTQFAEPPNSGWRTAISGASLRRGPTTEALRRAGLGAAKEPDKKRRLARELSPAVWCHTE